MPENPVETFSAGALPSGVRDYNERLLLTMIRRLGPMAGSELSRRAGLSAQTVSVILRSLENDGLVVRGEPVRGRVGKPSVPISLDPRGAFSFGMKIGRRSSDLALMDLSGTLLDQIQIHYQYPLPDTVFAFLRDGIRQMTEALPIKSRKRIGGIGIAAPFDLWKWNEEVGASSVEIAAWQTIDIAAEVARFSELPTMLINDATAGCHGENVFGNGARFRDYAYFFVGFFVGGGIVLNNSVFEGRFSNAGAMGPLRSVDRSGRSVQLMDIASLHFLEDQIAAAGGDPMLLWDGNEDWSRFSDQLGPWIDEAAYVMAAAALSACAVVDFEAIVIDGAFPEYVRTRLVDSVRANIQAMDARGLIVPEIEEGGVGANARVLGAAYGPISAQHFLANGPSSRIAPDSAT